MATKRATAKTTAPARPPARQLEPEPDRPTEAELLAALERYRTTTAVARAARAEEADAARHLVDVLRRAGLRGLVL